MAIEFNTNAPLEPPHVEEDQTPADAPKSDQNPPEAANQPQDPGAEGMSQTMKDRAERLIQS